MNETSSSRRAVLGGALALAAGAAAAAPAPATPSYRVVVQVSDADQGKWNLTLNNVRNIQQDLGAANVAIEIVAFGPGISMLKGDSAVAARLAEAVQAGVVASACENSMRGMHLEHAQMAPGVGFVPSGAAAIVKRQAQGWAYFRS
ncbi:MAG: DsrE family protein [Telluria sp.]